MESSFFFGLSTMAYMLAMVVYIVHIAFRKKAIGVSATGLTVFGFAAQTLALGLRWHEFYQLSGMGILRSIPLTNLYESLIFFVWCLILGYLIVEFRYKNRSFGAFVTPVAGIALLFISLSGMSTQIEPLVPALQSNWLLAHVTLSFISYSAFALAFSTGLMYLVATTEKKTEGSYIFWTVSLGIFVSVLLAMGLDFVRFRGAGLAPGSGAFIRDFLFKSSFESGSGAVRLISYIAAVAIVFLTWRYGTALKRVIESFKLQPAVLDEVTYKSIAIGFPIFTLGALVFGAIWANQAWGVYWSWDPKETWSLITWFIYAFYLHARFLRGWRGRKISMVAVMGFVAVVFTYLGVNLLLSGLHSYGSQ
ncbi:MAG: c-type cytochrome biogenesis protein CcsB [Nitrospiraceae bacterium]|nr:c-type cytochrome biogenesis protein CcsB [Nitrospiraceae bacterium]